ncbi:MAG TPA: response regulator transcription factor [Nitrospiraceae bacterium]|nr:response regulator transcription factor [Nitrospiraceae bacterium]
MTRILIADDHPFVRYGVKHVLEDEFPGVEIGEAASAPELLEQSGKKRWDMIVLDVTMPGRSGLDALHELKAQCPDIRVLVLSMHPEDQFAVRVLRAGAAGYLTKESIPDELVQAVRRILAGGKYIRSSVADLLALQIQCGDGNQPLHARLSDREFQVLAMIARGKTVTTIADELSLSVKSISTYRSRILDKLNLKTTADLTRYAVHHNLVE